MNDIETLKQKLRQFAEVRDWNQFHSPKNLAMALAVETAEILEHFQWLSEAESQALPPDTREEVEMELGDTLNYLIRLADKLDIDLIEAADRKIALNEEKYPAEIVRGSSKKYTQYEKR